ncbi:MAG: pentose kinase [Anaerolineales bacterium]|nr:pentose kinase [Anaerolineales bacterium]
MNKKIIAYDLGTGGNKASLYDSDGICLASTFVAYDTYYPQAGWHEQRPMDWWNSVVESTRQLLGKVKVDAGDIECLAISGHSLGVVPVDAHHHLLRELTPIWSDARSKDQARRFFEKVDQKQWYMTTGNGFPPELYSLFKIMWYRDNEPEMYKKIHKVIGTKDFINAKMTGQAKTDYSYVSGCGGYDLKAWDYSWDFIEASGIAGEILPEVVPSTEIIGELTAEAAKALGLPRTVKVACGGVDNSCMALGARNIAEGRVYTSLGSSSWIAVSSEEPVLDADTKPFVFTHVIPNMFTSAVSIFSAGSSFQWVRNHLCKNLVAEAEQSGRNVYELMTELAAQSPVGAKKLLFNPNLAGGSSQEKSAMIRGAFSGLDLGHTQADVIRACMEGIALNLGSVLEVLKGFCTLSDEMTIVGGGSKSDLWRQIFADI